MPIIGVGTDIIETSRIKDLASREPAFLERVFTQIERDYSLGRRAKYQHLAGRFAAKEAVAKALGRSFSWQDVEVTNDAEGKPLITLYGEAKKTAKNAVVHLSISHVKDYASAVVVIESL